MTTVTVTQDTQKRVTVTPQVPASVEVRPTGPQGPQGARGPQGADALVIISEGIKSSALDAGTMGDESITDDYLYKCVKTGTAGNAIWKKVVMFQT